MLSSEFSSYYQFYMILMILASELDLCTATKPWSAVLHVVFGVLQLLLVSFSSNWQVYVF